MDVNSYAYPCGIRNYMTHNAQKSYDSEGNSFCQSCAALSNNPDNYKALRRYYSVKEIAHLQILTTP